MTKRARDYGIQFGVLPTGAFNAITDVPGVLVGQKTVRDDARGAHTGVTAILPHAGNVFKEKVPAGIFLANAFGKMAGYPQVKELGNLETPIVLVNTLNVAAGLDGLIDYTFSFPENDDCRSLNGLVGETNDGIINDIRQRFLTKADVLEALTTASSGPVAEGSVGAGTGTRAFGFKAGIGTASRQLPYKLGGYTVGVLVQANFGGFLTVNGVEVGKALGGYPGQKELEDADGSIMMIVATDAPVLARNLERMAKRAFMGLAKTGGIGSNGSGDFAVAFSTFEGNRIPHVHPAQTPLHVTELANDDMTMLFTATIEATEEAIINSLFAAKAVTGYDGKVMPGLPIEAVLEMLRQAKKL